MVKILLPRGLVETSSWQKQISGYITVCKTTLRHVKAGFENPPVMGAGTPTAGFLVLVESHNDDRMNVVI